MSTRKVFKNSIIYSGITILQKATTFLLLPVFTAYLSTTGMGVVGLVLPIISILAIFYTFSLHAAGKRFYFEYANNPDDVGRLFGTIFLFVIILGFTISFLIILFNFFFPIIEIKGVSFYPFLFLAVLTAFFSSVYLIYQQYLQTLQEGVKFGINTSVFFIINISVTLVLLVKFELGVLSIVIAIATANFALFLYTLYKNKNFLAYGISKRMLNSSLHYSVPLIPHALSSWIQTMADRFLLNSMINTSSVGIYTVGFQFGNIINIISSAINQAFVPWFFQNLKKGNKKDILKFSELIVIIISYICLILSLFGEEAVGIMTSVNFHEGWKIIPFIGFAYVFHCLYYFFSATLFYKLGKTKLIPIISISGAVINIILNLLLIPKYMIIGAAIASLISNIVTSIIALIMSNRSEVITFNWKKMYSIIILFFSISLLSFIELYYLIILKVVIVLIITIVLYFYYKSDILKFAAIFKKKKVNLKEVDNTNIF
ncbi:MAG: oligosaccharide flippase family protein [Bacteroidales bacterium]|nr:oligosaccharide flippase family protein [Bacteroidales bacterium]